MNACFALSAMEHFLLDVFQNLSEYPIDLKELTALDHHTEPVALDICLDMCRRICAHTSNEIRIFYGTDDRYIYIKVSW